MTDGDARVFPSRIADLGFSVRLPADWISHELPVEEPDFSNPTLCFPLAVVTAPHAAIVFTAAARPVYENGTISDWATYLLSENGIQPRAMGEHKAGALPALVGEAVQPSELGPMVVRFAFCEDGGRLINLSLSTPEMLDSAVRDVWFRALASFALATPRGTTAPLRAPPSAPAPAPEPPAATSETPAAAPSDPTFATYAVADTAATLDPEHRVNVNMRDRGTGLVPRVLATHDAERRATIGAGAIVSILDVPYGWHVIDDGRRTLLLDPAGKVQISLSIVPREGRENSRILDEIEAQTRKDYPAPEFVRMSYGRIEGLGVRSIAVEGAPVEQYHLLYPHPDNERLLRARVTTSPERREDAGNLAELVLNSCRLTPEPGGAPPAPAAPVQPNDATLPAWWQKAVALELRGDLAAAEKTIRDGVPSLHFAHATADLYKRRMLRLKAAGDERGALAAFRKSRDFIRDYASYATSGSEGAALSDERDEFLRGLVAAFGRDPE